MDDETTDMATDNPELLSDTPVEQIPVAEPAPTYVSGPPKSKAVSPETLGTIAYSAPSRIMRTGML